MTYRKADSTVESTKSYSYDTTTHLLSSCTDSLFGTCSWSYDPIDRLIGGSKPGGSLAYTLDDLSRRIGLQVPGQGAVSYAWDATNDITGITQNSLTAAFTWDALLRQTLASLPNGVPTQRTFDARGRLSSLDSSSGRRCGSTARIPRKPRMDAGIPSVPRQLGRRNRGRVFNFSRHPVHQAPGAADLRRP